MFKKKLKRDHMYLVDWVDSSSLYGVWSDYSDLRDLCSTGHCQVIGWYDSENEGMLAFYAHRSKTGQCGGTMAIPRVSILKATRIK